MNSCKTKIFCLLLIGFFCSVGFASEIRLKEKLANATPGSYLVIQQNKTFTFLHIYDRFENRILLEETSIPAASFAKNPMNWKVWFESGAPGNTAWIMSQVNLDTGVFEETYSFTHRGWIDMAASNPFLTTLLNLRFHELSQSERRRIGLPPGYHKQDTRPLWNPRLTVNGQIVANSAFAAYKARWPSDGSDLSRKVIEIYLPADEHAANLHAYPTYFPFWLEVDGKIGSAKVRVVDSGMGAHSPKLNFPKRMPQLTGEAIQDREHLVFHLKSPSYYQEFVVIAEAMRGFFDTTFPVPCISDVHGESIDLIISKADLIQWATPGEAYRFSISPKENPSIVLETRAALKINDL